MANIRHRPLPFLGDGGDQIGVAAGHQTVGLQRDMSDVAAGNTPFRTDAQMAPHTLVMETGEHARYADLQDSPSPLPRNAPEQAMHGAMNGATMPQRSPLVADANPGSDFMEGWLLGSMDPGVRERGAEAAVNLARKAQLRGQ